MEAMREAWTDERLDDLKEEMGRGFDRVDRDLREVKSDVRELRGEMEKRFESVEERMDKRFARLEARFDSMQRMTLGAFLTIAGLIVTQL